MQCVVIEACRDPGCDVDAAACDRVGDGIGIEEGKRRERGGGGGLGQLDAARQCWTDGGHDARDRDRWWEVWD